MSEDLEMLRRVEFDLPSMIDAWDTPAPIPADPKPTLEVPGDDRLISTFAAELAGHLVQVEIFLLNGDVVIEDPARGRFQPLRPYKLVSWIEQWLTCNRIKGGELVARSMSVSDAFKVLNAPQFTSALKPVDRFNPIRLPLLRGNDLTLLPSGYHAASRTFTARNSTPYELDWSKQKSVEFIDNLLREFPFASPGAKAGVVAVMVTVFCLGMLSPTCGVPAFVYTANDAGCGKGLCAMLATVPVVGFLPTGIHPSTEQEFEKVLFSAAKAGQQILFLDNVDRPLASPALESFLTTSHVSGRLIGQSTFATYPKKTVVLISGNNITVRGDMRRRSVFVEFFLEDLQPEHRAIQSPLDEATIQRLRPQILAALYGIVKAWVDAKQPKPSRVMQGFVEWSNLVAGIVEHAGFESPVPAPQESPADEDLIEMTRLVQKLHQLTFVGGVPFRDLVHVCRLDSIFETKLRSYGELTRQEKTSFSKLLKRFEGRVFPGRLRFVANGVGHGRRYAVQTLPAISTSQGQIENNEISAESSGFMATVDAGLASTSHDLTTPT